MQDQCRLIRELAGMQISETKRSVGVNHRLHVNLAYSFDLTDIERILTEQFSGTTTFDVTFFEAGVDFFDEFDLFGRQA